MINTGTRINLINTYVKQEFCPDIRPAGYRISGQPDIWLALPDTGFQKRLDIRPAGYPVHP